MTEGIKELEEYAGAVTTTRCTAMTADVAELEAELLMLSDPPIVSGGSSRRLPKTKQRPAAAADAATTKPPQLQGSAALRRPAAVTRPKSGLKSSPYKLATSKAYHNAVKIARKEKLPEKE